MKYYSVFTFPLNPPLTKGDFALAVQAVGPKHPNNMAPPESSRPQERTAFRAHRTSPGPPRNSENGNPATAVRPGNHTKIAICEGKNKLVRILPGGSIRDKIKESAPTANRRTFEIPGTCRRGCPGFAIRCLPDYSTVTR